ncbi:MAG: TetR/AcrR family transcriptional regulator [Meiothermus sp.]|nr:TetR/AcrR family transcriptional regulator [Meiothermus sp.]
MPYPAQISPQAILEAALELLEQEGSAALSMRNLAERLGVRAPSLYRHYADKEALERALSEQAAIILRRHIGQAAQQGSGRQAVLAAGRAYLEFARRHPELYALLTEKVGLPSTPGAGKDLWGLVLSLVGNVTGNPDDTAAAVALWSLLHGFAVLERSGMFGPSGPQGGLERGLEALLGGLEAQA